MKIFTSERVLTAPSGAVLEAGFLLTCSSTNTEKAIVHFRVVLASLFGLENLELWSRNLTMWSAFSHSYSSCIIATVFLLLCLYSQVPDKRPPPRLLIFYSFPTPRILLGPSMNFKEIDLFLQAVHFLSLLVLFTPNFHGKIAYCCIYFSVMLYDNPLFLLRKLVCFTSLSFHFCTIRAQFLCVLTSCLCSFRPCIII